MSSLKEWKSARLSNREYELLPRSSIESSQSSYTTLDHEQYTRSTSSLRRCVRFGIRGPLKFLGSIFTKLRRQQHKRRIFLVLGALPSLAILLLVFTALFRPSYSTPPLHYKALEKRCKESQDPGRGNVNNEKVFIAASLYDVQGNLLGGQWGLAIRELVQLLGPFNVHLSIYENDPDEHATKALEKMRSYLNCKSSPFSIFALACRGSHTC